MQKSPTAYFFSMKKLLYIALFLLIGLSLQAATYTCQTNAGELRIHIKGESSTITHLTVTGQIDGRDFSFINDSLSHLVEINLKGCTITAFESRDAYLGSQTKFEANTIPANTFFGFSELSAIQLPQNTRKIGDYAFAGCSWLVKLSFLPEGLQYIGRWPFYGMRMLFSAQIPSTVQEIGDHAFDSCTRLYTIMAYPAEPPLLGEAVFENVPQSECFLGVPDDSRSLYLNAPQWKEFNICNISGKDEIETDPQLLAYFEHATLIVKADEPLTNIALFTIDGRMIYRQQGETTETAIETQAYPGKIFILSVQLKSGEYRHLKLGRTN